MKKLLSFLLVLCAVSCGRGVADKAVSIMPGPDFRGWKVSDASSCTVSEDNLLTISGKNSMTYTGKVQKSSFGNFRFDAMVKTAPGAAAAVKFHVGEGAGYSVLINNTWDAPDHRKTGSLGNVRNVYKSMAADGEFFPLSISVIGKHIQVKVNDILVADYVEPLKPYRIDGNTGDRVGRGTFVIESSAGTTEFRDIRVTPLAADAQPLRSDAVDETTDPIIRLQQQGFPVIDFHVHLKGWGKNQAIDNSRKVGIFYGIAINCGIGFPITRDEEIDNFIDTTRNMPAFVAMQGEGREWPQTFSKASMDKFDYVFTDALTFTDHKGRRVRLWIDSEVIIDIPEQKYMDMIVDKAVEVITNEPIDIYVNPCFLPSAMAGKYDELWTDARIKKVVDALAKSGVALEVNAVYSIPNAKIIKAAMNAGVKLAFGTNNMNADIGKLDYCVEMIGECGITPRHMYFPRKK